MVGAIQIILEKNPLMTEAMQKLSEKNPMAIKAMQRRLIKIVQW